MKKLIFLFSFLFVASMGYAQLKVVAPGDVGIGTSTPTEKLDVDGSINLKWRSDYKSYGSDGTVQSLMKLDGQNNFVMNQSALGNFGGKQSGAYFCIGSGRFFNIQNSNNNAILRVIESTGNMGIGINNPTVRLHVSGDIAATGTVTWSDKRLKDNIKDFELGIEELKKIQPKTYVYQRKAGLTTDKLHVGVLAQDFEKIIPDAVGDFVYTEEDEKGNVIKEDTYKWVDETYVRYLLVNTVKSQDEEINALQDKVDELESKLNQVLEGLAQGDIRNSEGNNNQLVELYGEKGGLQQNMPNPFNETTIVNYVIPERASNAHIQIFDLDGSILKTVQLNQKGAGQLTIKANELAPGTYMYNLVIDGQLIDAKKMVLTK